jgi:hypothetical protein
MVLPKRLAWLLGLALALSAALAIGAVAWLAWRETQRGWTVERLELSIAAEVPPGCTSARVTAWFDAHGIRHGPCQKKPGGERGAGQLGGLADADFGSAECGTLDGAEANVGFWEDGKITVNFCFDREGRLIGHHIDRVIYSL